MINVIDVVAAVFLLLQLIKSLGSPIKIIKGVLLIVLALILFGVIARLLLEVPLPKAVRETIEESYFVKTSHVLIKWVYPAIEKNAPKVDTFIKDKIISTPTPEVAVPKVVLPKKALPLPKLESE